LEMVKNGNVYSLFAVFAFFIHPQQAIKASEVEISV